jgi:SAM-dependent methyltransferase
VFCWICRNEVPDFLPYGLPPRRGLCPRCGAKPRGRLLGWLLKHVLCPRLPAGSRLLEAGASKFSVEHLLTRDFVQQHRCAVIDLRRLGHHHRLQAPHDLVQMDLVQMGFRSDSFDLILCNNTLPYVSDDFRALREIRRCLKPDGLAIINTHREPGPTMSVTEHRRLHPELDDDYYAVNGDQRVYGDDFFDRVGGAGLACTAARVFGSQSKDFLASNGLKRYNEILFAYIDPSALRRCRHADIDLG